MNGSFGPLLLLMKSIGPSQCHTCVFMALSVLGNITISLPCDTQQITTMNAYLATLGAYISPFFLRTLPNLVFIIPCLPNYFASPPKCSLQIALDIAGPTATASIQHYQMYLMAASSRMSLNNLQQLSPSARDYLEAVSNDSAPWRWSDAYSPQTEPPILSSTCSMRCSCCATILWEIASTRIRFASGQFCVCPLHHPE